MFTQEVIDRFNLKWKINRVTGCWEWTASQIGKGYGQYRLKDGEGSGYAHRVSWLIYKGDIPDGKYVCHRCDNRICVNPDHLWLGTCADNQSDMARKARALRGERNPCAKLTEDQVRKIRQLLDEGLPQTQIAEMFGIQQMQVSRIKSRSRWAHVE